MKVYNTLTRKKEIFKPMDDKEIKIYVCGPTVYNYFHIGNARPFVVFDTLRRYLEYRGSTVKFVQNFTDVDDKIINRANDEGVSPSEISEKYIKAYYEDAKALNVKVASVHPKVTDNINEIVDFVKVLVDKGYAYVVDGDVYYSTSKFEGYGKLSGQNIADLESGARIDVDERKQDPLDFALWKAQKNPDEIAWDSPWGKGRPGWHIECSAMSKAYLGDTIDIHAGGQDLTFPHHENEIAQSEAANGQTFANYWMHNGYITIDKEKMSKSKGNFFTVRDILEEFDGEVVRYFLLSGHYRSPIDFSLDSEDMSKNSLEQAKSSLERMYNAKNTLEHIVLKGADHISDDEKEALESYGAYRNKFVKAMDDDLNTADAISTIFELISEINHKVTVDTSKAYAQGALAILLELASVLGLLEKEENADADENDPELSKLIEERKVARENKDWAKADEIRDILKAKGIVLKDTPQGVQIIREN